MNILVSNMGNRNIAFFNDNYINLKSKKEQQIEINKQLNIEIDFSSFKNFTKSIKDNYSICHPHLTLQIIDVFLTSQYAIDKVILVETNTLKGERNDQDTIHEAKIITNLLKDYYHFTDNQIQILTYQGKPTDNEKLLQFFTEKIKEISTVNEAHSHYIFCDSGGTPQMKTAMKLAVEFILKKEKYQYFAVEQGNPTPTEIPNEEFRRILNLIQVRTLLEEGGNFKAAQKLLPENSMRRKQLSAIEALFNINIKKFADKNRQNLLILSPSDYAPSNKMFIDDINNYQQLALVFHKAWFYHIEGEYNYAILHYCIFIEQYLEFMIKQFKLSNQKENVTKQINAVINYPYKPISEEQKQFHIAISNSHYYTATTNIDLRLRLYDLRNRTSHDNTKLHIDKEEMEHPINQLFFNATKKILGLQEKKEDIFHILIKQVVDDMNREMKIS